MAVNGRVAAGSKICSHTGFKAGTDSNIDFFEKAELEDNLGIA